MELTKLVYSPDFGKKQAEQTGVEMIERLFDEGLEDPIKVFSNLARLKAIVDSAEKKLREKITIDKEESYNGVKFTFKNGAKKLKYEEDELYRQIQEKLKSREKLLKLAHESKDTIYDSDGCEVPKVSAEFNKSSITVSF